MSYKVYVRVAKRDGKARACIPDLPGCSTAGISRDDAVAKMPAAIAEYLAWLRRHGEAVPVGGETTEIVIADEAVGGAALYPGDRAGLFAPDLLPLTDEDIARYLRLMRYSRQDLLSLVKDLSAAVLNWRPAPKEWTIREVLRHLANAEGWYLDRIGLYTPQRRTRTILARLELIRAYAYEVLSKLTPEQRSVVVQKDGEPWNARKVFRRFLEHEREHSGQIQDVLRAQGLGLRV